jgi:putative ABC transport system substrate-binding protein
MKRKIRDQKSAVSRSLALPFLFLALCAMLFARSFTAEARQTAKIPRIGYLTATSLTAIAPRTEAFRQGLRDLGYVEGQNILIEHRHAEGKLDRLPALAGELVRLDVDVIVSAGPADTRAARQLTDRIPIVMAQDSDPVGNGFIRSLARPGGNITGLATLAPETSGKRLELLREAVPKLSRVAVFGRTTRPGNAAAVSEVELAAAKLVVRLQYFDIDSFGDIGPAFEAAKKGRADAVLLLEAPVFINQRTQIAELAVKNRLPVIYSRSENAEAGGLISYGASITDLFRRAATYVDKILKGAKPGDLPIEQPTKFELVINLKAAKQIGLTIPPNVLSRADQVIR